MRSRRCRRKTVGGSVGEARDDVGVVDPAKCSGAGGEGEVGVRMLCNEEDTEQSLFER